LDLGEVTYVDAAACWRLDDATRASGAGGGHVLLIDPRPVERTLWLSEVDELRGRHVLGGQS
jgi:hypothetical protein